MSFLEVLADKGVINRYQIDDVVEKSQAMDGDVDEAMALLGIDSKRVAQARSDYYGVPLVKLEPKDIGPDTLKYIPEDSARHYRSLAFGISDDGTVLVGMVDPGSIEAENALQFIFSKTKTPYKTHVISYDDFKNTIKNYSTFSLSTSKDESVGARRVSFNSDEEVRSLEEIISDTNSDVNKTSGEDTLVEDAPATKSVAVILKNAIEGRASDVHIEPTGDNLKVRFRVDGELFTSLVLRKELASAIVARVKILARMKLDEKRKPQDGRFPARVEGRKIDFRVSTMPTFFGEKVVIRILDPGKGIAQLENTGMTSEHLEMIRRAIHAPYGMILITGPTGSGKSTTLYSILSELDREKFNVVSLEDPVEYNVDGVSQSQVHPEIGYTFANGLRSILRQDPDIIMVGEIRDAETAQLAIQAALTGHLVLSTLHTNTALGAIPRLIDMGIDPYLIAPTLIMTIAQRLTKRICEGAEDPVVLDGGRKALVERQFSDLPQERLNKLKLLNRIHEAKPTKTCPDGTRGRVAVFEMLEIDKDIERMILENPNEQDLYKLARAKGMLTMKEDAIMKSMQGIIPWSEVNKF